MSALVTGAGGFLGLYITEQLVARGETVRAYCRGRYAELEALGIQTVQGNLAKTDEPAEFEKLQKACEGVDTIYHVAAVSGIGEPWERYYRTNTLGTENLLKAAQMAGVPYFVFTSSPSVTFNGVDQLHVNEDVPYPTHWLGHYPHSKALAEQMVLRADQQGGMRTCALRPHLMWGPRDKALIPRLIQRAKSGKLKRVGDGSNLIDMLYIENAASAHLQAADALKTETCPVGGKAYFLSQGEPVNCWGWIDELLEMMGLPMVRKAVPLGAALMAGRVLESLWKLFRWQSDPLMTRFLALQLAKSHYFDICRAQRDFGYVAKISKEEGMERLRESLLRNA